MSTDHDTGRLPETGIGRVTHFDEQRSQKEDRERERRREMLRAAFDEAHQCLARRAFDDVAAIIDDVILDELAISRADVRRYANELAGEDLAFEYDIVKRAVQHDAATACTRIEAFERLLGSLESVAGVDGPLPSSLQTKQPVLEYRHQVGERYLSGGQHVSATLNSIDPSGDLKATLFTGGQGAGKSTSLETVTEDRIARGHKIIDLVDFHKAENVMYDVPDQSDLAERREELGLDVGFAEYDPPDVEILTPLSPDLSETRVPVDQEDDESIVKPFTIPASELTFRQLVMLLPHTTKTHENYLRSAHQKLSNSDRDWTLRDVADVVRNETNAGEQVCERIERSLRTAQNKSFIRDTECPHALEWDPIMKDAGTVSAFTVHMLREPTDQLMVLSYLLDCIYDERKRLLRERRLPEFPTMSVVMRELHKLVPRQKSEQDNESTIEGYMIDTMSELISLMRHVEMELIGDTQKFRQQLSPQVSGLFHRVFCFRGQKPDIRKVFQTRVSPRGDPEEKISQYDDGVCALVSEEGYSMPIQFAPPRCHHLDAATDGDGFRFRAQYHDHETLEPAPWETAIPERLAFGTTAKDGLEKFFQDFVRKTGDSDDYTVKATITERYNDWAERNGHDQKATQIIHRRLKSHFDLSDKDGFRPSVDGRQRNAWRKIVLDEELLPRSK